MDMFHKRQRQINISACHFYINTINEFRHFIVDDDLKIVVINSLQYLVSNQLVTLYGYATNTEIAEPNVQECDHRPSGASCK